jgi:hypothetical protein
MRFKRSLITPNGKAGDDHDGVQRGVVASVSGYLGPDLPGGMSTEPDDHGQYAQTDQQPQANCFPVDLVFQILMKLLAGVCRLIDDQCDIPMRGRVQSETASRSCVCCGGDVTAVLDSVLCRVCAAAEKWQMARDRQLAGTAKTAMNARAAAKQAFRCPCVVSSMLPVAVIVSATAEKNWLSV